MKKYIAIFALAAAILLALLLTPSDTHAQTQNQILPVGARGGGVVVSTSTNPTHTLGTIATSSLNISSTNIVEGTKLFFTEARALASTLTGFSATTGTVTSADSILTALQKLAGNAASYLTNITGLINAGSGVSITGSGTSGSPYVINATGGSGGTGNVATSTTETNTNCAYWTSTGATPATLGSDAGCSYNASADRLTVTYATTTGFSSSYASSTSAFFGNLSIGNITGLLKATAGVVSQATAGTDYEVPLTFSTGLTRAINAISCNTASASVFGCLSTADWSTFNSKESALTFTYPITRSTNTIGLAFGTTTANTWSQIQTFTLGQIFGGQTTQTCAPGKLYYDTDNQSLTFCNNDSQVALQIGQEEWTKVVNNTGSTIANGAAVYISGASAGVQTVALAQANAGATTIGTGLMTETCTNGSTCYVTRGGLVNGIDTSAFTAGQTVYISAATPGALTSTAPTAPNFRYRIGIVGVSSASVGTVSVTPSTASLGNGTTGQVLSINATGNQAWVATSTLGLNYFTLTGTNLQNNVGNALGINAAPNLAALEVQATTSDATSNAFVAWSAAATNLFRIRSDGNVGVNTSAPTALFEITGTTTATTTPTMKLGSPIAALVAGSGIGHIGFYSHDSQIVDAGGIEAGNITVEANRTHISTVVDSDMIFRTVGGIGTSLQEKMRLAATGVGIGTSTPFGTFAVQAFSTANRFMTFTDSSGNEVASLTNTGELGLATTTSATSNFGLAVTTGTAGGAAGDNVARFIHGNASQTGTSVVIGGIRAANAAFKQLAIIADYDGTPVEQLTFQGDGKLGLGTSTPYAQLSLGGGDLVVGAATAGGTPGDLYLPKLGTAAGAFIAVDASGKLIATSSPSSSLTGTLGQVPYFSGTNTAVGTSTLAIGVTSKVGVGTTTPFSYLTVAAPSTTSELFSAWGMTAATSTDVQIFTTSGTWTKPTGFVSANVYSIGGGGSGGVGTANGSTNVIGASGAGGGSSNFAATSACLADGGGGGAMTTNAGNGGAATGGTGGAGSVVATRGGGGGGSGASVLCSYVSAGVGSTVTVSVGKGGTSPTYNQTSTATTQATGGTGFFAGGNGQTNALNVNAGAGGGGAGATSAGGNASGSTGGTAGTGASSGGTVTNGSAGSASASAAGGAGANSAYTGTGGGASGASQSSGGDGTATAYGAGGGGAGNGNGAGVIQGGAGTTGAVIVISTVVNTATTSAFTLKGTVNEANNTSFYAGFATTTPSATVAIQSASSSPAMAIYGYIDSGVMGIVNYVFEIIDKYGHLYTGGPAPTASACTGMVVSGDDRTGTVTMTSASTCTMNFARAWDVAPSCTATQIGGVAAYMRLASISTTQMAWVASTNITSFSYICQAHK